MMASNNILLVLKTGGDFHFSDVALLCRHLHDHSSEPLNIYCLADIVVEETKLVDVTLIPFPGKPWRGWWSKMNLFSPALDYLKPFLFLDLDTAVLSDVKHLQDIMSRNNGFIALRDMYWPENTASGVMAFPSSSEKVSSIWENWISSPDVYMRKYRGDQNFIFSVETPDYYWQDLTEEIVSFKPREGWLNKLPTLPPCLVCFHGKPRPRKAAETIDWVDEYVKSFTQ